MAPGRLTCLPFAEPGWKTRTPMAPGRGHASRVARRMERPWGSSAKSERASFGLQRTAIGSDRTASEFQRSATESDRTASDFQRTAIKSDRTASDFQRLTTESDWTASKFQRTTIKSDRTSITSDRTTSRFDAGFGGFGGFVSLSAYEQCTPRIKTAHPPYFSAVQTGTSAFPQNSFLKLFAFSTCALTKPSAFAKIALHSSGLNEITPLRP